MRPDRFLRLALTAAPTIPGVTRAEHVTEDGRSNRPYLFALETGGKVTRWQVATMSAPGDSYDQPEREPALGDKPQLPTAPPAAVGSAEQVEGALIAAILAADSGEIAGVEAYSQRQPAGAIACGATFLFHSGAKIFLNHVQ